MARGPTVGMLAARPRTPRHCRTPYICTRTGTLPRRQLARGQTTHPVSQQGPYTRTKWTSPDLAEIPMDLATKAGHQERVVVGRRTTMAGVGRGWSARGEHQLASVGPSGPLAPLMPQPDRSWPAAVRPPSYRRACLGEDWLANSNCQPPLSAGHLLGHLCARRPHASSARAPAGHRGRSPAARQIQSRGHRIHAQGLLAVLNDQNL
jgi:hypothetical protein